MKQLLLTISILSLATYIHAQEAQQKNPTQSIVSSSDPVAAEQNEAYQDAKKNFDTAQSMINDKATGAAPGIAAFDVEIERLMGVSLERALKAYELGRKDKPVLELLIATNEFAGNTDEVTHYRKELKRLER